MTQTLRPQHDDARKIALTPYNRKGSYILVSNRPKGSRASINETGRNVEGIRAPTQDEIVVAAYTAAQEITHISPNDLNYIFVGAMGQGSSHALGLARGRPDGRVILFDGDGSLLTNLGSLVTIANQAPTNLVHCLCENGCYETTGSVPIPRRGKYVLPSWPRQGTVGRTKFPISPSGKASCLTSSKKKGRFSLALKSNPAKRTRKISRSYPAQSTGKNFAVRWPMADEQNYGISSSSEIYCGIGCLRNQSTRKSPRERIFCGVGFPGEKTRDNG